ncbi:MAG: glycosyltransferase [Pseudomonadota bacterium]
MTPRAHLVDTTLFFSPTSGGVRRYLLAKHAWLNRHALVRHTLLVPGPRDAGAPGGIVEFGSPSIPFGAGYRCPIRLRALRGRLCRLAPDLVEAGDPYHVGRAAATAARDLGIPAVAFCHSDLAALLGARLGRLAGLTAGRYLRSLYARFDLVLAPSQLIADRLRRSGVERVTVQPLGVDADVFAPSRAEPALRESLGLAPGTRLLVFAGRLAAEKNLPELCATVERLGPAYHLAIVGGARRARLAERVTVLPYERDPRRLAAWLAASDALVHAGRCETFGLVALEALACGLPVVAYRAGALPEIVDESVGELADPAGGPAALADAVRRLCARDPVALRTAARSRIVERYTWESALGQQLRLYASLLDRGPLLRTDLALGTA